MFTVRLGLEADFNKLLSLQFFGGLHMEHSGKLRQTLRKTYRMTSKKSMELVAIAPNGGWLQCQFDWFHTSAHFLASCHTNEHMKSNFLANFIQIKTNEWQLPSKTLKSTERLIHRDPNWVSVRFDLIVFFISLNFFNWDFRIRLNSDAICLFFPRTCMQMRSTQFNTSSMLKKCRQKQATGITNKSNYVEFVAQGEIKLAWTVQ